MNIFFTSDLHFGHQHVMKVCRRPFETTDEMDEFLIAKRNDTVKKNDHVYILGDLCYRAEHPIEYYLSRLSGKKHLIAGNHDFMWLKKLSDKEKYFEQIENMCAIRTGKKLLTLCHYPLLEWNRSRYATDQETSTSRLIHGHIHNGRTLAAYRFIKENLPCALNAGVDINDYASATFEQLIENNNKFYER